MVSLQVLMRPPTQINDLCVNGLNDSSELFFGIALLYFNWLYSSGYESNWASLHKIILAFWISSDDNLLKSTLLLGFLLQLTQFCLIFMSNATWVFHYE